MKFLFRVKSQEVKVLTGDQASDLGVDVAGGLLIMCLTSGITIMEYRRRKEKEIKDDVTREEVKIILEFGHALLLRMNEIDTLCKGLESQVKKSSSASLPESTTPEQKQAIDEALKFGHLALHKLRKIDPVCKCFESELKKLEQGPVSVKLPDPIIKPSTSPAPTPPVSTLPSPTNTLPASDAPPKPTPPV